MAREKVNLGLIGYGNIGIVHADAISKKPNSGRFTLIAVADPVQAPTDSELLHYADYQQLLQTGEIQAVSIATPPNTHFSIALDVLQAGKHVLLEKPPTLTLNDLDTLEQEAQQQGQVLFTVFHSRYRPEVEKAVEELQGREIEEITIVYKENVLNYHQPDGWIFDPTVAGGGVLMDSGINALSIVAYLFPHLQFNVESANLYKPQDFNVETQAHVDFSFNNNRKGTLDMDWLWPGPETREVRIKTGDDVYTIDIVQGNFLKNGESLLRKKGSRRTVVNQAIEYRRLYQDFATHLREGTSLVSTKELQFILDAYQIATFSK